MDSFMGITDTGRVAEAHSMVRLLKLGGAPRRLLQFVFVLMMASSYNTGIRPQQTEFFAGLHEATKAAWRVGRTAIPFDVVLGASMDMLDPIGFLHAAQQTLRTTESVILAPVCSSWVAVNVGTSQRSKSRPLGDTSRPYIKDHALHKGSL